MPPVKTIRIGPYDYSVGHLPKDEKIFGDCSTDDLTMRFKEKYASPQQAAETVIHELLHALWNVAGLQERKDGEERIVGSLATGFAAAIRDNGPLFKWIMATLK